MRNIIIIFSFCFLSLCPLSGQVTDENKLQVFIVHTEEDTLVRLRWAPANMKSWFWGIEHGYRLTRYTIAMNGVIDSIEGQIASKIVLDSLIKPLPENAWSNLDATEDQIELCRGAIYAESFIVDSMIGESELSRAFADQSDRESRFIYGLMAADQKFILAEAMGFAFLDENVNPAATYFYRVDFLGDVDSTLIRNAGLEVDMQADSELPIPEKVTLLQAIDSTILLSWDVSRIENQYVSYTIERSTDSINFVKRNELPLIASGNDGINEGTVFFTDKVPSIGTWYYYRVKGRTTFGEDGPPSEAFKIKTSPSPKASAPKITNLELISGDVSVDWEFPPGEETYISEFRIYRSGNALGPFILVDSVSPSIRTWTDEDPIASGYYRVAAHDLAPTEVRAGDRLIQLEDITPPPVPTNLSCSIDAAGTVNVSWVAVEDTGLRGYRVFSGNAADGTFGEETKGPVSDTFFTFQTTLKTLTTQLYVKVQSLDERENYSAYSSVCLAQRPDIVPPTDPVLLRANPLQMGVELEWLHSASEDLQSHIVQRKKIEESAWLDVLELDADGDPVGTPVGVKIIQNSVAGGVLMDTSASYLYEYQYRVLATDESDNKSISEILTVRPFDSGERGTITDLDADTVYSSGIYNVKLTWNYSMLLGLYDFQIYRSVDGKPMRAYATTNGRGGINFEEVALSAGTYQITPGIFLWKDPELGNAKIMAQSGYPPIVSAFGATRTFRYKVMARHFDGGWSPVSDEVMVVVYVPGG